MSIRKEVVAALAACMTLVAMPGCAPSGDDQAGTVVRLGDRESGYAATPADWQAFLACWHGARPVSHQDLATVIKQDAGRSGIADEGESPAQSEARLGVTLPASYRHFLQAYQPELPGRHLEGAFVDGVGMLPLEQVDRVSVLAPDLLVTAREYPLDAQDAQYFFYGVGQDDAAGRTRNLADALVVGKYGASSYELILLYPQVTTRDGEMEAALLYHAGEFRAPSFAELMRQLQVLETGRTDHVPPYPQSELRGGCADRLPLNNIWWK